MPHKSKLQDIIALRLKGLQFEFETEYRFHPIRRWRFDFALVKEKVAIEAEGGIWIGGRHNRGDGFLKDLEKYNTATVLGWRVFRFAPNNIDSLVPTLREALGGA